MIARMLWAGLGWTALGLGAIGVVLPLLPTVPFVLLAAFAFARSSERLHDWLVTHPTFGPHIITWRERGAIPLRGKQLASLSFLGSLGLAVLMRLPPLAIAGQALALACTALFIWTRPDA